MSDALVGLDIGGTKSAIMVGDASGNVFQRMQIETGAPAPTLAALLDAGRTMLAGQTPAAVGVSVGSPIDRAAGVVDTPPNMPDWKNVGLRDAVREVWPDAAFNLENDADAGALAEWRWGCEQNIDDLIYLTCGTGQGGGLILGARLHRGVSNFAGEIGHVRLEPDGPVGYHKAGSVEGFTSGKGLAALAARTLAGEHSPTVLNDVPTDELTGRHVGEAALAGDAVAVAIVAELGEYLGRTCAILIDVLNPQRISLGSLGVRLGDLLVEPTRAAAKREALPASYAACAIAPAALGERVQDLAALAVAMGAGDGG